MSEKLEIRESRQADSAAIEALYPAAFPDENLFPLVRDLLNDAAVAISLVGTIGTRIVGHAIFTRCGVVGNSINAALRLSAGVAINDECNMITSFILVNDDQLRVAVVSAAWQRLEE